MARKPWLGISDYWSRGGFAIAWFDEDDGEGGILGDSYSAATAEPEEREAWECWKAERVAQRMCDHYSDRDLLKAFVFSSEYRAKRAIAAIKLAFQQDRALPDWAQTALANGWKPPRGWKA